MNKAIANIFYWIGFICFLGGLILGIKGVWIAAILSIPLGAFFCISGRKIEELG
jgi:hypothetical protein